MYGADLPPLERHPRLNSAAAVIDGLRPDVAYPVTGEPIREGLGEGFLQRLSITFREGEAAVREEIGDVPVNHVRAMIVDAAIDPVWDDDVARDGLADLAFWGRHEVEVAAAFGAAPMGTPGEPRCFGWRDRPLDDARALARRSEAERAGGKGLAVDLRPHTDLWRVLEDLRASPTGSLQVEYEGSRLLFFDSVYGYGAVAISAERDAVGRLLGVVVDLDRPPRE